MKSHETSLLGLYAALLTDVERYYPRDSIEWSRDMSRLRTLVAARGTKFLTIDLVAAGKHFDRCLSNSAFHPSCLPGMTSRRASVIPRLFGGLLMKAFNHDGTIRSDVDITAISLTRQLYYAAKKVRMQCDSKTTYAAVKEYFDVEASTQSPVHTWDCDNLDLDSHHRVSCTDPFDDRRDQGQLDFGFDTRKLAGAGGLAYHVVQRFADLVASDIGEITYSDLRPRHGPGAVSDKRGRSKYFFTNWPKKLELSFPSIEFALPNASFMDEAFKGELGLSAHEPPSKLIAVPKTQKTPRLIASEPTAHQWMQQAIRRFLIPKVSSGLLSGVVWFNDQNPSREAALAASASGTGCTIDLSSASDRLSCWLVERMFRANHSLLYALHASRTRWLHNPIDRKRPQYTKLRKFAPMGSALTFVVQSVVYSIIAIGCTLYLNYGERLRRMSTSEFRRLARKCAMNTIVFGDDIIIPEGSYSLVSEVLTNFGLKVNTDKSYVGGNFYESCGVDAYRGVDVTPTYFLEDPVESDPSSIASAVDASNNLHLGGLWCTAAWLSARIPSRLRSRLAIVKSDDGAFGLKSFCGSSLSHLKEKWNDDYQQIDHLSLQIFGSTKREQVNGIYCLLQYFTEAPSPFTNWTSGESSRTRLRYRIAVVREGIKQPPLFHGRPTWAPRRSWCIS